MIVWDKYSIQPYNQDIENYCIDCRKGVVVKASPPLVVDTATGAVSPVLPPSYYTYMGSTTGSASVLYDFSNSANGPGPGMYLVLGSIVNPRIFTDTSTIPDTNTIYQINQNTHIYMMIITSDTEIDTVHYYNYGVVITPIFGHDSFNFSVSNDPSSNTKITLANNDTQNTYYWWYNKIF